MTPASAIIDRCGGFKTVAEWLGLERTAVQRWTYPAPKGTGEQVPSKHWAGLIAAAGRENITIALAELMPEDLASIVVAEAAAQAAA